MTSVIQTWVNGLTVMQQSVLLTAIRGPDGIHKSHVSKKLVRWLRRCVLYSAFDKTILDRPYDKNERKGGSFTGPSLDADTMYAYEKHTWEQIWPTLMHDVLDRYMLTTDEMPHHFQLHFIHAAEILGYK